MFNADFGADEPSDPLAACPPQLNAEGLAVATSDEIDIGGAETLAESGAISSHAYLDGGMHPSFRKLLRIRGAKDLAKLTSLTAVPISRPEAALADPHKADE